jgi:hypothetical protein
VESASATNDIELPPARVFPAVSSANGDRCYEHQVGRWPMIDAHQQDRVSILPGPLGPEGTDRWGARVSCHGRRQF